jgi:hypothetical protein
MKLVYHNNNKQLYLFNEQIKRCCKNKFVRNKRSSYLLSTKKRGSSWVVVVARIKGYKKEKQAKFQKTQNLRD